MGVGWTIEACFWKVAWTALQPTCTEAARFVTALHCKHRCLRKCHRCCTIARVRWRFTSYSFSLIKVQSDQVQLRRRQQRTPCNRTSLFEMALLLGGFAIVDLHRPWTSLDLAYKAFLVQKIGSLVRAVDWTAHKDSVPPWTAECHCRYSVAKTIARVVVLVR